MKNLYLFLLIAILSNACAMDIMKPQQLNISVSYMQTADAISDAKKAIQLKNNTLIGFDQRGLKVPGVKADELDKILTHCPVQRVSNMGDIVKSKEHLTQMQKVHEYSLKYNQAILAASSCQ